MFNLKFNLKFVCKKFSKSKSSADYAIPKKNCEHQYAYCCSVCYYGFLEKYLNFLSSFTIASLNVRGIGNKEKRRLIFNYYRFKTDIICLQETHSTKDNEFQWKAEWGGAAYFAHGTSNSQGVCILIKKDCNLKMTQQLSDPGGRFCIVEFETQTQNRYALCCIYAPNKDNSYFFDSISQNLASFAAEKILIGDFNVVQNTIKDRYQSLLNNKKSKASLDELCNEYNLSDTWRVRNPDSIFYSWKKHTDNQASRIDYCLMSKGTEGLCDNIMYYQGIETDHCAMYISINDIKHERGCGYWKLNASLLNNENFCTQFRSSLLRDIASTSHLSARERWEKVKERASCTLKRLSRQTASERSYLIAQLSEILMEYTQTFPLDQEAMKRYEETKKDLTDLLYDRTRSTIFHSKVQWHSEGEHNSSTYFFNLEKNRYNLKTCHTLLTDDGILIEDQKSILQAQEDFYRLLYKKDSNVRFRLVNSSGQHLAEELQELLNLPISFNEITAAVNFLQNPVL